MKPKTCATCKSEFTPAKMGQRVCSPACALTLATNKRVRAERVAQVKDRRETKLKLDAFKTKSQWAKEAQTVVNKYARLRDMALGRGCVTCGATPAQKWGGTLDAGHFRSVGSAPHLRFYLPQISLQCVTCNRYQGGRALDFRRTLVERHGSAWVESLEAMQGLSKFDIPYLQRLKAIFTRRIRRLEKRTGLLELQT